MLIIGIDPGRKGGIAVSIDNKTMSVIPMVSNIIFNEYLTYLDPSKKVCYFEEQHPRMGNACRAVASYHRHIGGLLAILELHQIPIVMITPSVWKKHFLLLNSKIDKKKKKLASIAKARELFPNTVLRPTERCKTDSDGMAEALLIAEYGRYNENR